MRVEPSTRDGGVEDGLAARLHDPLWLLARQWQLGEFRADDTGSPVVVDVEGRSHALDGWRASSGEWEPWDVAGAPLERLVEQEVFPGWADPVLRLDGGARWSRSLAGRPDAVRAFVAGCRWPAALAELTARGLAGVLHSRVPDGAAVAGSLRLMLAAGAADAEVARLGLSDTDRAAVLSAAGDWLRWWESHGGAAVDAAAAPPVTWDPHRLEHQFSVRASTLPDVELVAAAYPGGAVDWPSLDAVAPVGAPAGEAAATKLSVRGIPMPARFGGMPAARFWEMEDAKFDPGSVDAAPYDLARLMLVAYATVYGNDWCAVPVRLPVGTLLGIDTFTVTDVFGATTTMGPAAATDPGWNLFGLTDDHQDGGSSPWFLLAPSLPESLEGPELESVLLARDEMTNLAWAVELRVPDAAGQGRDRYDAWVARELPAARETPFARYQVETEVPAFWYPLAPEAAGVESVRLRLVPLVRRVSGAVDVELPLGEVLADARSPGNPVWLFEEEVPRSGVRMVRRRQRARWHDGSVHAWTARRRQPGTGESSSGLAFDVVLPPTSA